MSIYQDFFNKDKKVERVFVETGVVNGRVRAVSSDEDKSEDEESKVFHGQNYVQQYRLKERNMYEVNSLNLRTGTLSCVDDASSLCSTTATSQYVIKKKVMAKAYNMYSFDTNCRTNVLPIDSFRSDILNLVNSTTVVIIQGPTGCGKTTQVPQFLIDHCRGFNEYCNIAVTQPRKIAAITTAKRVCYERGWPLGTICGYQVGLEKLQNDDDTILTYMTTGVLLMKLINAQHLNEFTHIIIDEVHERSQDLDFLLLIIRRFLFTNSLNVKVIIMSATFETEKFAYYFRAAGDGFELKAPTVFVELENKYRISCYYLDHLSSIYPNLPELHLSEPILDPSLYTLLSRLISIFDLLDDERVRDNCSKLGHVLVFLPGIHEIEDAHKHLTNATKSGELIIKCDWLILPLHSMITGYEQKRAFLPPSSDNTRKIILSTNIAESSITVPDVEYVIDFCLTRNQHTDPDTHYQTLKLEWATHVNCTQRSGRAGRVCDGRVYRLVPKAFYENSLLKQMQPEILRAPLERLVLLSKRMDFAEPPKAVLALALDPPNLENIEQTVLNLKEAGALLSTKTGKDSIREDGDLTFLGHIMLQLPIDIKLSKLVLLGYMFGCMEECIIMAGGCSLQNIFMVPFQDKVRSYTNILTWSDGSCSDLIAHYNLYKVWSNNKRNGVFGKSVSEAEWCVKNFVSLRALREWSVLVEEITKRMNKIGLPSVPQTQQFSPSEKSLILKVVICGAFYPNYFNRSSDCGQIDEREAVKLVNGLNPMKTVYFTNMDKSQPGPVYNKRIKDIFKGVCTTNMDVHFDTTSKIYISFADPQIMETIDLDGKQFVAMMPGDISMDVYKAVKMRQISHTHTIKALRMESSWQYAKRQGIATGTYHGNYQLLQNPIKSYKDGILPTLQDITMHVYVSYVIDAGHFYVQPVSDEYDRIIARIDDVLNSEQLKQLAESPVIGYIYAARFDEDNRFYRCKVLAVNPFYQGDLLAQVVFIDFGNTSSVKGNNLYAIPEKDVIDFPPQAMECVLSNVQPSVILNSRGLWSNDATRAIKSISSDKELTIKIFSMVNDLVAVELYKSFNSVSYNQWLVQQGFATVAEESFLSKEDNNRRIHAQQYSNYNETEHVVDINPLICIRKPIEPPALESCKIDIKLKGPYSPLEMNIYSATDNSKLISVDRNSVNAVLLDSHPQDPHERLLVAASISESSTGNRLLLRNTTVMPNIHGFPALMAMIFCPEMAPKPTKDGTCFAAILCGLGCDSKKRPIYPAHDLVMTLDTILDKDELIMINEMRFWLNQSINIMYNTVNKHPLATTMQQCQNQLRTRIINLLKKPRVSQPRKYVQDSDKWGKFLYEGDVLEAGETYMNNEIWKMHWTMTLNDDIDFVLIKRHLDDLNEFIRNGKPMNEITCKLCDVTMHSVPDVQMHIISSFHKEKLEEYVV